MSTTPACFNAFLAGLLEKRMGIFVLVALFGPRHKPQLRHGSTPLTPTTLWGSVSQAQIALIAS
jgi:hypothetical protein